MPKNPAKRAREYERLRAKMAAGEERGKLTVRPKHKRRRIADGLIGMSSAAVLTIYALGYANTQNANGATGDIVAQATPVATRGPQASSPTATLLPGTFRDGTYKATGTSRHGDIEATVVVRGGKIISADVTDCGTRYPCSDVDRLVEEVVSRQGAPVHYMSGATDSSRAYTQAVQNALAQAS